MRDHVNASQILTSDIRPMGMYKWYTLSKCLTFSVISSLSNVSKATIDAVRVCGSGKSLSYDISSDGAATLMLSDGRALLLKAAYNI